LVFEARTAESALRKAKRAGEAGEFDGPIPVGKEGHVFFEFVGVQQLMELGSECDPNEVWYEIREMFRPMERKKRLIPPEKSLYAFDGPRRRKRPLRPW
jgi:hypothetical protein